MNAAQLQIAEMSRWLMDSSQPKRAPFGDLSPRGPYAVLVPTRLDEVPSLAFEAGCLPLFIPTEQALENLPAVDTSAPKGQDVVRERIAHILWKLSDGILPKVVAVGLEAGDTIQTALSRDGLAFDLTERSVIAVCMWALPAADREVIARKLPIV